MKHVEPLHKVIGEYEFHIHPFSAFKSANVGGELISVISPILVSILPALTGGEKDSDDSIDESIFDMDISNAMPSIMQACSSLDGDKLEGILRSLISKHRNIAFNKVDSNNAKWLDSDEADAIFTGRIEDMFVLAFEVIKLNFKGFFKNLGNLSGNQGTLLSRLQSLNNTDTSTGADSAI